MGLRVRVRITVSVVGLPYCYGKGTVIFCIRVYCHSAVPPASPDGIYRCNSVHTIYLEKKLILI